MNLFRSVAVQAADSISGSALVVKTRLQNILVAKLLLCFLLLVGGQANAAIISGTVWDDINADALKGNLTNNVLGTNVLTQADSSQTGDLSNNTYGDPAVAGAGVESGLENIQVCLSGVLTVQNPASPPATINVVADRCMETDSAGLYAFDLSDIDPDATGTGDLVLTIYAKSGYKFSSDDPSADNDADQQVSAPVPPDLWTGAIVLNNYSAADGDVVDGTDAGLRPTPEIILGFVDLNGNPNDGEQGIETGTPDYNVFGNCSNTDPLDTLNNEDPEAGDDCARYDDYVRSNDLVVITPSVTLDNSPDGGVDNVILEMQFSPVDGAELQIISVSDSGLPVACLTDGVSPASHIINNPDGSIRLICNVGNVADAQLFVPVTIRPTGNSPDGSSFITEVRSYAADNDALPSNELPVPEIDISSLPRFDLSKSNNNSPPNRISGGREVVSRVNPLTGEQELGYVFQYDLSITADADGKGASALAGELSFKEIVDPRYAPFGAHVVNCSNSPYNWFGGRSPLPLNGGGTLPYQENATANSGNWACAQDGSSNVITVDGADTSGGHFPTTGNNGNSTAPYKYVSTGSVAVFYPLSAFFRYAGPDKVLGTADDGTITNIDDASLWQEGDDIVAGSYPITNCVGDFDPSSASGISNYGSSFEPGWDGTSAFGNNCRSHSKNISSGTAGFGKFFGQTDSYWLSHPTITQARNSALPGSAGVHAGDSPVVENQTWAARLEFAARQLLADSKDVWLCETLDNASYNLSPVQRGSARGLYAWGLYYDGLAIHPNNSAGSIGNYQLAQDLGWMVEYGRFTAASGRSTWQNNHFNGPRSETDGTIPVDASQQQQAALDCGESLTNNGSLEWTLDPDADAWDIEDVVMVRLRPNPEVANSDLLQAGDHLYLFLHFSARGEFYSPDFPQEDGQPIADGVISTNVSNFRSNGTYGQGSYDPTLHAGIAPARTVNHGDRVIHRLVQAGIDKQAYKFFKAGSVPGDDDLFEDFAGDQMMWSLHPSVSAASDDAVAEDVTITDVIPQYASYSAACSPELPDGVSGPEVRLDTPNPGETTLVYRYDDPVPVNVALEPISVCTDTDPFTPTPIDIVNEVKIEASNVTYNAIYQEDERTVGLVQAGRFAVRKSVDFSLDFQNDEQVWSLRWGNTSGQITFAPPDVIDVFPFNGDGRGALAEREVYESKFTGSLVLTEIPAAPVVTGENQSVRTDTGQWYATCDASDTINQDPSNAAYNDLTTGSTNWIAVAAGSAADPSGSCSLSAVNAIRWVSASSLLPKETSNAQITLLANDNDPNDLYVNRFTAYTDTFLNKPLRSNEPFVRVIGFSLGDLVWLDMDGNGVFNKGTDFPAPAGTRIELHEESRGLVDTTTTDENGRWIFESVTGDQASNPGSEYVAGRYYVTVPTLPNGWNVDASSTTFEPDPGTDINENRDHHSLLEAGVVRSSGLLELSATISARGAITGDEPGGDNVSLLGDLAVRDDLTNFTLDLMLIPSRADLRLSKRVTGGGPIEGWKFQLTSLDPTNCPLPSDLTNPATANDSGQVLFEGLLEYHALNGSKCEYRLAETSRSGWTLTGFTPSGPLTVDSSVETPTMVTATNARDVGSIEVTKTVNGAAAPAGWTFSLKSLTTGCDVPTPTSMTTTNGSGGSVTFINIPTHTSTIDADSGLATACKYQVTETAQSGWTQKTSASDLTDLSVTSGETTKVGVTNDQDAGSIQVTKTVNGKASTSGWEFTLSSVTAGCVVPSTITNPAKTANGSGGVVTFSGLPVTSSTVAGSSCKYKITETAQTGWSLVTDAEDMTDLEVSSGETTQLSVVNSQVADVVVEKTVTPEIVAAGGEVVFTIKASNNGVLKVTGLKLTDLMDDGLSLISATPADGTTFDTESGVWTIGELAGDANKELKLTVSVNPVGGECEIEYTNRVSVTAQSEQDFDTENNSDSATASLVSMALTMKLSDSSPIELEDGLQRITYELMLVNTGVEDIYDIQIQEDLIALINNPHQNGATIRNITVTSPDTTLTPNKSYNGSSVVNVLSGRDTLVVGSRGRVDVTFELMPDAYFGPFIGSATATATALKDIALTDISEDGDEISTEECSHESPTPLTLSTPTTPITLGWFRSREDGGLWVIDWATEVEVSNAGFNVSVQNEDGSWTQLNDALIQSKGDSTLVQEYQFTATPVSGAISPETGGPVFRFTDVSVMGKSVHHGPYELGQTYGRQSDRVETNWETLKQEDELRTQQREEQRKLEMQQKLDQMKSGGGE